MKTIGCILLCALLAAASCKTMRELTVISYNVSSTGPRNDSIGDYVTIANQMNLHSANIVALQGVDFTTGQHEGRDAITVFRERAYMESGFAANVVFDEVARGVGILTAVFPLESWQVPLPGTSGNPIALIHEYGDCVMVSTQFADDEASQLESAAVMDSIASIYAPLGKPIIVAGSMPFTRGTPAFERMSRNFSLLNYNEIPTHTVATPVRDSVEVCVDYIWAYTQSDITYRVYESTVLFSVRESGHKPVKVSFICEIPRRKR